jgi:hypothetical protein
MVPRVTLDSKGIYQAVLDDPFSKWNREGVYTTLSKCNAAKAALSRLSESKVREKDTNSVGVELASYAAECIDQDDPRLKRK